MVKLLTTRQSNIRTLSLIRRPATLYARLTPYLTFTNIYSIAYSLPLTTDFPMCEVNGKNTTKIEGIIIKYIHFITVRL